MRSCGTSMDERRSTPRTVRTRESWEPSPPSYCSALRRLPRRHNRSIRRRSISPGRRHCETRCTPSRSSTARRVYMTQGFLDHTTVHAFPDSCGTGGAVCERSWRGRTGATPSAPVVADGVVYVGFGAYLRRYPRDGTAASRRQRSSREASTTHRRRASRGTRGRDRGPAPVGLQFVP